ncbi:MAG: type II toxin-antitoxin system RelE/ParE family toxin [Planctomycetota bacterium]
MTKVRYTKLASSDLFEYSEYIGIHRTGQIHRSIRMGFEDRKVCATLAANPKMGEARKSKNQGPCRSFTSGKYVIFFRAIEGGVEIIRIVRGGLDLDNV